MASEHDVAKHFTRKKKFAQAEDQHMKQAGTRGSLTRIAKAHGESPLEFARSHTHDPNPLIREKSLFAANMNKGR